MIAETAIHVQIRLCLGQVRRKGEACLAPTRSSRPLRLVLFLCVFALNSFFFTPSIVNAQDALDWGVAVFAEGTQGVSVLSADGVRSSFTVGFPLESGTFPSAPLAAISADRRALAALDFIPGGRLVVKIAAGGTCCKALTLARDGVALAQIGGFSPNGRRFAVSYVTVTDAASNTYTSTIAVIDVEMNVVVTTLERGQIGGDYAWLRDGWNDDGIGFVPLCYGCDDPIKGLLARWNPDTGDIQRDLGTERLTQDTLALTGETIAPARRPDYPVLTNGDNHPNVVTYNARVIYYNARSLEIDSVHWVADGWQILIVHPDRTVLLDRTGVKRELNLDDQFLVGTPDGWLGTRPLAGSDAVEVVHHTLTDLSGTVIARFYHPVGVLDAPALGATATQGGFPDVPSPVARITCPNTLSPRLYVGGKGRVIGGGVYLRREPSLNAATMLMVTDQTFDVLGGPNCDPTGIAWWEVGIGGVHGWMAESKDGNYLLEPVID